MEFLLLDDGELEVGSVVGDTSCVRMFGLDFISRIVVLDERVVDITLRQFGGIVGHILW